MGYIEKFVYFVQDTITGKPKNRYVGKKPEKTTIEANDNYVANQDRRKFFKQAVGLSGVALASTALYKGTQQTAEYFKSLGGDIDNNNYGEDEGDIGDGEKLLPTEEQLEIDNETAQSVAEIFKYGEEINLNTQTLKKIENYWLDQYAFGKQRPGIEKGLSRMSRWLPSAKREFSKVFDDKFAAKYGEIDRLFAEDLVYLALTESHGDIHAVSSVNAVGAYQFMRATALEYKLKVNRKNDERKNPVKSAAACARFLKDLYIRSGGDWNLALPMYNGAFPGRYLAEVKEYNEGVISSNQKKANLNEYLLVMEAKIKKVHHEVRANKDIPEKLKTKETEKRLSDIFQNLAYAPKTKAIIKAINGGLVAQNGQFEKHSDVQRKNKKS